MKEKKINILLVEDDPNLGMILKESLELRDYSVELHKDGESAWAGYSKGSYDLCLLDVMMPKKDGFTLAADIRKVDTVVPIIFLTAKSLKEDKIEGFKVGADDYMTKPFSMEELELRMEAILRRSNKSSNTNTDQKVFQIGKLNFNYDERKLTSAASAQNLTTKEADLLKLLCIHQNNILERDVALKSVWNDDNYFTGRSMDVYITKLRKYLKEDSNIEIINIHGTGFRLMVKDAS
jgi:two-component system OmpR family response regulator